MINWSERTKQFGRRAVHAAVPEDSFDTHTEEVWGHYKEVLDIFLADNDVRLLDFGAGAGRFSARLAELSKGFVWAWEPCEELRALIPREIGVVVPRKAPGGDAPFDAAFVAHVMGGMDDDHAIRAMQAISNCLKYRGLVFMVENTSAYTREDWWPRTLPIYIKMWGQVGVKIQPILTYREGGDSYSIFAGRMLIARPRVLPSPKSSAGQAATVAVWPPPSR